MRNLLGLLCVLLATNALAFEIHPIGVRGGANEYYVSAVAIDYRPDWKAAQCSNYWYIHGGNTQGIHEIITREAYQAAYKKVLRGKTWLTPLLAGTEWNDDPEELLRKAYHYGGRNAVLKFAHDEADARHPDTLTRRTHHGDLQFLHAMHAENEDETTTKERMSRWIEYTYSVAIGQVDPNTLRKKSPYHEFYEKVGCSKNPQLANPNDCTVMDVFDIHRMYRYGDQKVVLADLATGSLAHLIQDSFSASHTLRENGTGKLQKMYTYDTMNQLHHCESDGAYNKNKGNFNAARDRTIDLLVLVRHKTPWQQAKLFFNDVLALNY